MKNNKLIGSLFILSLIGILLFTIIMLASSAFNAIHTTNETFGPGADYLPGWQQVRLAIALNRAQSMLTTPVSTQSNSVDFTISSGESVNTIIDRLFLNELVLSTSAVYDYLIYTGHDRLIQTGSYALSPSMNAVEIIDALIEPGNSALIFVVIPGWRIEEIAASTVSYGLPFSESEFINSAQSPNQYPHAFVQGIPEGGTLEGYLYPTEYSITRNTTAAELIGLMLTTFETTLLPDLTERAAQQNLTLHEAVTLASIVEREAVIAEEKPMIASVYHNRLAIGMQLQADPTVQYAIGYNPSQQTWWTNPLSYTDLEFYSPYNTYIVNTLPPGPIANPDLNSLLAVVLPTQSPYYFFQARCDGLGYHAFTVTYEEHLTYNCP